VPFVCGPVRGIRRTIGAAKIHKTPIEPTVKMHGHRDNWGGPSVASDLDSGRDQNHARNQSLSAASRQDCGATI
jgi:hypothetical protein